MFGNVILHIVLLVCIYMVTVTKRKFDFTLLALAFVEAMKIVMIFLFDEKDLVNYSVLDMFSASLPFFLLASPYRFNLIANINILLIISTLFFMIKFVGYYLGHEQTILCIHLFLTATLLWIQAKNCYTIYREDYLFPVGNYAKDLYKYFLLFSMLTTIVSLLRIVAGDKFQLPLGFGGRLFLILISAICFVIMIQIIVATYNSGNNRLKDEQIISSPTSEEISRYQSSSLSPDDLKIIASQIQDYLRQSKKYLDANLTLEKLSTQTAIPKHHISQAINFSLRKSFHNLMADYRIQYSVNLLEESSDIKFQTLAYSSGFNSVSAFYKNFKKINGMTPAEYVQNRSKKSKAISQNLHESFKEFC